MTKPITVTVDPIRLEGAKDVLESNMKTIAALADALIVLTALERAPKHHDTHPSHELYTGGGYAHGQRLNSDTLPVIAAHIKYLADDADNEVGSFFERLEAGHA